MPAPPPASSPAAVPCYSLRVLRRERSGDPRRAGVYASALDAALRGVGVGDAELATATPPPAQRHHAELLHLVCLGAGAEDRLSDALDEPDFPELVARAELLCLEVWEPGGKGEHGLRRLATRALRLGAKACVVPRTQPSVETWRAWWEGFYSALNQGKSPRQAMKAGDALSRAREGAEASFTLVRPRGWVGVNQPLVVKAWRPLGWPAPSRASEALLKRLFAAVTRRRCGYVGVEQLLDALEYAAADAPGAHALLARITPHHGALRGGWAELSPAPSSGPDWRGTPRLRAIGERLLPGFEPKALVHALGQAVDELLIGLTENETDADGGATLVPAQCLEVVGGPEDGRLLSPEPGERLGRASLEPAVEHPLYVDSMLTDPRLSRSHMRWLGGGHIELPRAVTLRSRGLKHFAGPGKAEVFAGDILELTRATRLRGLP